MENIPVAIVTGASRGIGRAVAKRLAEENYHVIINYRSNHQAAEELKEEIERDYGFKVNAELFCGDVSDYAVCEKMVKHVMDTYGRIDVLVNNAGVQKGSFLMMNTIDKWWRTMEVNLGSTVNCSKLVIEHMIKQKRGSIINIGSVSGERGAVGNTDYSASKAAVHGFTRALAKEVCRFNIKVNCIAPGFIESDMTNDMPEPQKQGIKYMVPMKRMGKAEDIAQMVAMLVTERMNYMIGQTIYVDGGITV